jgi:DNA repair exonuclease SbcCD ATPase subunit
MAVILKKLTWSNMFSYGSNNSIELASNKITQLAAPNGSGKSSLALIIQELLYNKNVKGLKKADILNKYNGAKTWEATIYFSVDSDEYELTSKRQGASTKVYIIKNGKDISEHKVLDTYKELSGIIGRDFETFSQLTYQSSTDVLEFLKATDTNRKKFLVNLFNLSKYLEIGDDLKLKVSKREKDLAGKTGELKTVEQFLTQNIVPEKAQLVAVPEIDASLPNKIEALRERLLRQKAICDQIDKNNLYISDRAAIKFEMGLSEPCIDKTIYAQIESIKKDINTKESTVSKSKKDLQSLDTSDHCYACKQAIDNSRSKQLSDALNKEIDNITKQVTELKTSLKTCQEKVIEYDKLKAQYESNQKDIDRFTQLSQLIDSNVPTDYPNYNEIALELKNLKISYDTQVSKNEEAIKYNDSVKVRNAKIEGLKEQIIDFKARQELIKNDILSIQEEIACLTILRKAFSTSGIVAYKLENVAKQLEEGINHYLSMLSDGQFQIIFRLTGDKLNIIVINNGEEVSIDSLSGGEFSRVQTAVLLAVRSTLSKIGGKSINLLFLDEITGVLDDAGKEKLFEVLQEETDLNVFLISHDYSHPLIPKIEIEKINNISTIYA